VALVEILVTPRCPYERAAITRVEVAAQVLDAWPEIRLIIVSGPDEAQRHAFFGSPTIRVDGRDIVACTPGSEPPSLRCRLYDTAHGLDWVPDVRPIYNALAEASNRESLAKPKRTA
jgi:hypothetical protein